MDNITHSLLGLMVARVLPRDLTTGWKIPALLVVASNAPDIDRAARLFGVIPYLEIHRGYTHSLLLAPVLALACVAAFRMIKLDVFLASLGAILLHLALDWTNVSGIRALLPFSDHVYRLDAMFESDPVIVLPTLFALGMPALIGLIGNNLSKRREATPTRGFAWFAIIVVSLYCGARVIVHKQAVARVRYLAGGGGGSYYAFPVRFSLFQWRGVAQGEEETTEVPFDLLTRQYRIQRVTPRQPTDLPVQDILIAPPEFQFALDFTEVPVWTRSTKSGEVRLLLVDLRFGPSMNPEFHAEAILLTNGLIEGGQIFLGPGFE